MTSNLAELIHACKEARAALKGYGCLCGPNGHFVCSRCKSLEAIVKTIGEEGDEEDDGDE